MGVQTRLAPVGSSTASSGFEILAKIAEGGMGSVYLARPTGSSARDLLAVKFMHPHLAEDEENTRMLLDEARLASLIRDRHVVGIVDLGTHEWGYYLALEYVHGPSLSKLLKRSQGTRPPALIIPVVIDALVGLHAAHELRDENGQPLQVIHRDVNPQNILVGSDGVSKLTDFGVARASTRLSSTQPGMRKGKWEYMAPEQVAGDSLDCRTDVFSMGIVLWNALTGERLFRAKSVAEIIHGVMRKEIPRPSTVGLQPPAVFDDVIMAALSRSPDLRPSSAGEMATALREAAVAAGQLGSRTDVAKWVQVCFGDDLRERERAAQEAAPELDAFGPRDQLPNLGSGSFPSLSSLSSSWSSGVKLKSTGPTDSLLPVTVPGEVADTNLLADEASIDIELDEAEVEAAIPSIVPPWTRVWRRIWPFAR